MSFRPLESRPSLAHRGATPLLLALLLLLPACSCGRDTPTDCPGGDCAELDPDPDGDVDPLPDGDPADPDPADDLEDDRERPERDADDGPVSQCGRDEDCPLGQFCGPMEQCVVGCVADAQCAGEERCAAIGRCLSRRTGNAGGPCAQDIQCPSGQVCRLDPAGLCADGCRVRADCGIGTDCIDGACQAVADLDPELDLARCDDANPCPDREECVGGICLPAVSDDEPVDEDVIDAEHDLPEFADLPCDEDGDCPEGAFCNTGLGVCYQECSATRPCDANLVCDPARGRCVPGGGDIEVIEIDQSGCRTDADCFAGTYCKNGVCDRDCTRHEDCAPRFCSPRDGRCVAELPPDEDLVDEEQTPCLRDDQCPTGRYCLPQGYCGFQCLEDRNCGNPGETCDERGRCVGSGGDEEACILTGCPSGSYCAPDMRCRSDCDPERPCSGDFVCDLLRGRCVLPGGDVEADAPELPTSCTRDESCPVGEYCALGLGGICQSDCARDQDCGLDAYWRCTARGQCVDSRPEDEISDADPYEQEPSVEIEEAEWPTWDDTPPAGYCGPLPLINPVCWSVRDCRAMLSTNGCQCLPASAADERQRFVAYVRDGLSCVVDSRVCDPLVLRPCDFNLDCVDNRCVRRELPPAECRADSDCRAPAFPRHYCNLSTLRCVQDCNSDFDCGQPTLLACNDTGRCIPMGDVDVELEQEPVCLCSEGSHCNETGSCVSDCSQNTDCPINKPGTNCCDRIQGRCFSAANCP